MEKLIHGSKLLPKVSLKMKLTVFLVIISLFQIHAKSYSQNPNVTLHFDQIEIKKAFEEIQAVSDINFLYNVEDVDLQRQVSIHASEKPLSEVLSEMFKNTKLTFELRGNQVVVFVETPVLSKKIEQRQIHGTVTSEEGMPLIGATVLIKGTRKGTITNFDGEYSIEVSNPDAILVFSYIGYETKEISINETTSGSQENQLDVQLKAAVGQLSQVFITTGYYSLPEERATGSFSTIKQEQIDIPASSIAERLVGVVPGLRTTINPDGTIDFEIRGQTSLYADQEPLIVYDGFPIEGGFSSINPNDIENIVVLKDAAAASIWGAKSANGVIVITSKNAKKGEVKISGSSFVRFSDKLDLDYVNPLASSADVIAYEQKGFNSVFFGGPWPPPSATVSSLDPYSLAVTAMSEARLGRITTGERDAILSRLRNLNNDEQIEEYLLQFPIINQYNVSISGGNERMGNYLSLMYENKKDFYKGNESDRILIHYKNNVEVTDWLDFNFSGMFQYNESQNNGVDLGLIKSLAPYDMLVNEDGSLIDMSYLHYYIPNLKEFVPTEKFPYSDWSYNPITEIKNRDLTNTDLNTRFQAGLTFKLIEGLTLSSKLKYEIFTSNIKNYYDEKSFAARSFINETSGWNKDFNTEPVQNVPSGGILRQSKMKITGYNFRNQLSFARTFAEKHAINFIAGSEVSNRITEFTRNPDAFGYDDDKLTTGELLNPVMGSTMWNGYPLSYARYFFPFDIGTTHAFSYRTDRFFSLYANAAYTFDGKYTLSGSYRTDASNLITNDPKYRFSPFWSMGLGWQIDEENFMQAYNWIDKLNFRFSYGYNGNVDKSTSFKPLISVSGTLNPYTEETIASISSYGNPTLRWEKTNTINFGLDFSILNRKLYGTFEVYKKESSDLIVSQSIASVNGTTSQKFNNGEMVNKGIEISLGTSLPLQGRDIVWDGNINFSYNKNRITKFFKASYRMYDLYDGGTTSYVEGYNANTLWSLRYAGMINIGTNTSPNMQPSFYGIDGEKLTFLGWPTGDASKYESNEGTTVAPIIMGMRNSFEIYDFDFSFIITAKFGHVFRRQSFNYPSMSGGNTRVNIKYGEVVGSDPSQIVPIPDEEYRYYFWDRFYPYLDYLTANASHIRFQEISLAYTLPSNFTDKIGINSVKIYAMANNVGVILFNDFGEDPEYPLGTLKPMPKYTLGLNFTF